MTTRTSTRKPQLIALRGLPASGKTVAARSWVRQNPEGRARVGRDALRDALYYERGVLSRVQEGVITDLQRGMVRELLRSGKDVVVDDLNLRLQYLKAWQRVAAEEGAEFSVLDTDADVNKCIKWDKTRPEREQVGERFIRDTAKRFARRPELYPIKDVSARAYSGTPGMPDAYLVDVDGTLALNTSGRSFYDMTRVGEDAPNAAVIEAVRRLKDSGAKILVVSGRTDDGGVATAEWLDRHLGADHWDELLMRDAGDSRADDIVKPEIFDKHIRSRFNVLGVIDDRASVVRSWRSMGLTVFQVAEGNF